MNTITRKLGIAVFTVYCLLGVYAFTSAGYAASDEPSTAVKNKTRRIIKHRDGSPDRKDDDRRGDRDRERRHYGPEAFRQFIKAELEHLPSLNNRMERLMRIQAERHELQKQRQAVASNSDGERAATIEKFHSLLRRDLDLSDESRKIAKEIIRDLPDIQKQLKARETELQQAIDKLDAASPGSTTTTTEARELRRKIRYVEFVDKKLRDLENHPERLDLLIRMLRGVPFDDWREARHGKEPRTPEAHLTELRIKRRTLQRELRQVENEINLLKEKGVDDKDSASPEARP